MAGAQGTLRRLHTATCAGCNCTFSYLSEGSGRRRKYCSKACKDSKFLQTVERCVQCLSSFVRTRSSQRFCSDECRLKWQRRPREIACVYCGATMIVKTAVASVCSKCVSRKSRATISKNSRERRRRICQHCGSEFIARWLGSNDRREGVYCSRACQSVGNRKYVCEDEKRAAQRRRARMRNPPPVRSCQTCGVTFSALRGAMTYCSDVCRSHAQRPLPVRLPARACRKCGSLFEPSDGRRRLFCSAECVRAYHRSDCNHRRRARRYGAGYEPVDRIKVFERDRWTCQICGSRTPKRLCGSLSPRAPELDHRVPLAIGGSHSWENCQCACRQCNGHKGGRRVLGQLSLFPRPARRGRGTPRQAVKPGNA